MGYLEKEKWMWGKTKEIKVGEEMGGRENDDLKPLLVISRGNTSHQVNVDFLTKNLRQ